MIELTNKDLGLAEKYGRQIFSKIPGIFVYDMDGTGIGLNVSNAFDKHYFTKRPQFYPGPGIWPSDGRTFSATVSLNL
ncbi:hypothetical protein [Pedobacter steynii]